MHSHYRHTILYRHPGLCSWHDFWYLDDSGEYNLTKQGSRPSLYWATNKNCENAVRCNHISTMPSPGVIIYLDQIQGIQFLKKYRRTCYLQSITAGKVSRSCHFQRHLTTMCSGRGTENSMEIWQPRTTLAHISSAHEYVNYTWIKLFKQKEITRVSDGLDDVFSKGLFQYNLYMSCNFHHIL